MKTFMFWDFDGDGSCAVILAESAEKAQEELMFEYDLDEVEYPEEIKNIYTFNLYGI